MSRYSTIKPELPPIIVPRMWTCPVTGLIVPKDPERNLRWRAQILQDAETDPDLQLDLYTACSKSLLFYVNAFCFTLRVFETKQGEIQQAENTHLPFVTWPLQDDHLTWLEQKIDKGQSGLTDKSRDMGATWDHIVLYTHRLLFRADESHLMLSWKEDYVDNLTGLPKGYPFGNLAAPGTLFGKVDYVLNRLPEWMVPRLMRKGMSVVNLDNRTRIDGESSGASAGSSSRHKSIFLDEMAKMKEAEAIKRSTADVTACRLVCSTPNGAGTTYSKWRMSGTIPVFVMGWYDHPEKGFGRYTAQDDLGRWEIRSPWFDKEALERTPKELAIEICMDHIGSGDQFFESNILEQHKKTFGRDPLRTIHLGFKKGIADDAVPGIIQRLDLTRCVYGMDGAWRIWTTLNKSRPDQGKTYTVGVDISKGQGASNSVISIACNETREKIAEYADANIPPYELAKLAVVACLWAGGRNKRPLLIWENNGDPGADFGRQITHVYQYPNIYFDKQKGTLTEKKGKRYGWRSDPEKKAAGLGMLRRAYARGRFINHSKEALEEALMYVYFENGGIGPATLVHESDSARKAHGDRVIADMLCVIGAGDTPKDRTAPPESPQNSIGGRFEQWKKAKRAENDSRKRTFDFAR